MIFLDGGGRTRTMRFPTSYTLLLPQHMPAGEKIPLVLCLHALGEDRMPLVHAACAENLPDRLGMALVIPDGRRSCFLNMSHGPAWNTWLKDELLPNLRTTFHCRAAGVVGVDAGALGALALAREGLPCALISPCTSDAAAWHADRWPRHAEWLGVFEGQENAWQPGAWEHVPGLLLGDCAQTSAQLGLEHWQRGEASDRLGTNLVQALEFLRQCNGKG